MVVLLENHSLHMNLYILNEVLSDYTSGMVVIAAPSKERCRELFIEQFGEYHADEFDKYAKFTVIEGVQHPEGIVDYVYGGG
jgi:hypothetical protein